MTDRKTPASLSTNISLPINTDIPQPDYEGLQRAMIAAEKPFNIKSQNESLFDSEGHLRPIENRYVNTDLFYGKSEAASKLQETLYVENNKAHEIKKHEQNSKTITEEKINTELNNQTVALIYPSSAANAAKLSSNINEGLFESNEDENVSAVDSVFSTQLDENVLEAARARNKAVILPKTALTLITNSAQAHYLKGLDFYNVGNFCHAIHEFNKALSLCPDVVQYLVDRAESYFALCDLQSAIIHYRRVCLLMPKSRCHQLRLAAIYYFQAQCHFDQGLYPEALESFSRSSELQPENEGCQYRSIACLAALKRHSECLALVNKRLSQANATADLYILRARLHEHFRNVSLCFYDVRDALALDPAHSVAKQMMNHLLERAEKLRQEAVRYSLLGRYKEALQQLNFAINTNPSAADYHVFRGTVQRQLRDFNAAIDDFLLAFDKLQHDESHPLYKDCQRQLLLTYNDFAVDCFNKGFYEEAVLLLNKAIRAEKSESGLYINRGDCFYKQGDLKFALLDYLQAEELTPNEPAIAMRLAFVYYECGILDYEDGNYKDAEDRFILAINHNPLVAKYYIARSKARQMMDNQRNARLDIIIALLLQPTADGLTSNVVLLFPGKSVTEILSSPLATEAKQLLAAIDPKKFSLPQDLADQKIKPSVFSYCIADRDLQTEIVVETKQMNKQVRKHLDQPGNIKPTKLRIGELPEPSHNARRGGNPFALDDLVKENQQTGWRKFNLKLSSLM